MSKNPIKIVKTDYVDNGDLTNTVIVVQGLSHEQSMHLFAASAAWVSKHSGAPDRLADATRPAGTPASAEARALQDAADATGGTVTHAARAQPVVVPKGDAPEGLPPQQTAEQLAAKYKVGKPYKGTAQGKVASKAIEGGVVVLTLEDGTKVYLEAGAGSELRVERPAPAASGMAEDDDDDDGDGNDVDDDSLVEIIKASANLRVMVTAALDKGVKREDVKARFMAVKDAPGAEKLAATSDLDGKLERVLAVVQK